MLDEHFRRAIDYLTRALASRHDGCVYNDKALCLAELGKYQEALACFNEGIRQRKDHPALIGIAPVCAFCATSGALSQ
ncbi:MAG: tetratricopeptide repeat protein [Candidatus Omnitrophica bacterium]|nr:tetratricopeptide repeat protein [Candidatus Omnitrophota bacterium]